MNRTARNVIPMPSVAPEKQPSQIQRTRALAQAFAKLDRAEAAYRAAQAELCTVFHPWAAGRSISRDEAREHLESTGYLPNKRIWE